MAWTRNGVSAGVAVNHVGSFDDLGAPGRKVDSYTTVDLYATYELAFKNPLLAGLSASLHVNNVFSEDPPEEFSTVPNLSGNYGYSAYANPVGRMIWIGLKKKW